MMSEALMKYETIDRDQIDDIMAGKQPRSPEEKPKADKGSKADKSKPSSADKGVDKSKDDTDLPDPNSAA